MRNLLQTRLMVGLGIWTALGLPALAATEEHWTTSAVTFLNDPVVSFLLLTIGFLSLFPAMATLGTGAAETLTIICFGLFFGARYWGGIHDWLPLALFVVGIGLLGVEILLVPGMGKPGFLGALAMAASIVMSFPDVKTGLTALVASALGGMTGLFLMIRYLPRNKMLRKWMVLEAPQPTATTASGRVIGYQPKQGQIGVSCTPLRPGGFVEFDGNRVDVLTDGEFIEKGRYVRVVKVEGNKVVVVPAPPEAAGSPSSTK